MPRPENQTCHSPGLAARQFPALPPAAWQMPSLPQEQCVSQVAGKLSLEAFLGRGEVSWCGPAGRGQARPLDATLASVTRKVAGHPASGKSSGKQIDFP